MISIVAKFIVKKENIQEKAKIRANSGYCVGDFPIDL